jgi:CRP/FNR family transcriptional regulator, cyclic AMP receptor protein
VVIRIGGEDLVQFFTLHVKDEHRARVISPRACRDEPALMVETLEDGTMCRAGGEALRGSGEGEFNDQHASDGTGLGMIRSVSADTHSDWRSLAEIPLLGMLTEVRLRALWARSRPHRYVARQVLRNAGDPATHLLLLLHGRVAATVTTSAGRIVRFGDFAAPCALDKVAVIDGRGHTATLTALTACAVRSLPRDLFDTLVDSAPAARRHVLRVLADHARHEQERFAATATLSTETRLAAWLLEQAGRTSDSRVTLPGSQESLADLLGVTRVTISRALTRLQRDGLIIVGRGRVDIVAPELLNLRARG